MSESGRHGWTERVDGGYVVQRQSRPIAVAGACG